MSRYTRENGAKLYGNPRTSEEYETDPESAPALDVNSRGFGRVAVGSVVLISVMAAY